MKRVIFLCTLVVSLSALACSRVEPSPTETPPLPTASPTRAVEAVATAAQPTATPRPSPTTPAPSPTPTPLPSAEDMLEQALANLADQAGYHFEHVLSFSFVQGSEASGVILETRGDHQAPAARQGTVSMPSNQSQSAFILSDGDAFWQYEEGGGWESGIPPLQLLDVEDALPQSIADMVVAIEGTGDDMRYHIQGTLSPEAIFFFAYWYDEPFHNITGELEAHYWIDPVALVPLEAAFAGTIGSPNYDLEVPVESHIIYSDFGLSVEIAVPHPAVGGHEFGVNAVAFYATRPEARFSPDGQTIIGTGFGELRQWNADNLAEPPRVMTDETFAMDGLFRIVLSPDGQLVATTTYEGELRLWRLGSDGPEPLGDPLDLDDPFNVVFSPDGTRLAVSGFRDRYDVWLIEEDGVQPLLHEQGDILMGTLAFHPDGRHLFVSLAVAATTASDLGPPNYETQLLLWDLDDVDGGPTEIELPWLSLGEAVQTSGLERRVINAIAASQAADLFLVSSDRHIYAWPLSDLSATPTELLGHGGRVVSLAVSPDGTTLASAGFDATILLWDLADAMALSLVLSGHEDEVHSVDFSPDGRLLLSASSDSTLRLWAMADPMATVAIPQIVVPAHRGDIRALLLAPDGELLVSVGGDDLVRFWRLGDGALELVDTVAREDSQWMTVAALSPDGARLALGNGPTIEIWQLDDAAPPIGLADLPGRVSALAFGPDGRLLALSIPAERAAFLWDLSSPQAAPVALVPLEGEENWSLADIGFSPYGGGVMALASSFLGVGQLVTWSVVEAEADPVLVGDCQLPYGVWAEASLAYCANPTGGTSLYGWDAESGTLVPAGDLAVTGRSLAYSPKHGLAASVVDGELLLWDLSDPEAKPRTLRGHGQPVTALVFTPDGKWLISAADDGTIRLWQIPVDP